MSSAKRLKRFIRYHAIRVALALIGVLPWRWAGALGEGLGALAFRLGGRERQKALRSLEIAFPEAAPAERLHLAERSFRHLARCAFELACVRKLDPELFEVIDWPPADRQVLERAVATGRGVVFVTGHVGNWELLARCVPRAGFDSSSIAKASNDPRLTRLIDRFRTQGGLKTIWRGRPGAARQMLRVLRSGAILGILIDQDTAVQSVFAPFFGKPAATPRAAADLALRTGASVVVGFCQRDGKNRYRVMMREVPLPDSSTGDFEARVVALTTRLNAEIEAAIRAAPEQWVWMHQRWKTQP